MTIAMIALATSTDLAMQSVYAALAHGVYSFFFFLW